MKYLDVLWRDAPLGEPVRLVCELDAAGSELRKLEFFSDGRIGHADTLREVGGTRLSLEPLPPLAQINGQGQFEGAEIEAAIFEKLWQEHVTHAI